MNAKFAITYYVVLNHVISKFGVKAVASTYEEATELLYDIMKKKNEEPICRKLKWSLMNYDVCYRVHKGWTEWMDIREIG